METNRFFALPIELAGISLQGYLTASFDELKSVFGEPNSPGDDYKVSTEWEIKGIDSGAELTIYDWKETVLYDSHELTVEDFRKLPSYEWHVGGNSKGGIFELTKFLGDKLGRSVTFRYTY